MASLEINSSFKGFPLAAHGTDVVQFLATKPNLFTSDFQFPIMVLRESALAHNIERMAQYCAGLGVSLAPHVKTPMSPQIAKRQLDAGAWGITVANYYQAKIFIEAGISRIIIANEVLEPTSLREIARRNYESSAEIIFYIDSLAGLKIAQEAIKGQDDSKLNIFMEIGAVGGRAGIRDLASLTEMLITMAANSKISVRGVSGFEGAVPGGDREFGVEKLRLFLKHIVAAAKIVEPYVQGEMIITAGGSSYFDYVAEEFVKFEGDAHIILRSGGYVSHDHIHYENQYPFMAAGEPDRFFPALELWSRVLSIPEPNLAILNFGKRDAGNDLDNPMPIKIMESKVAPLYAEIMALNDQHAFMSVAPGTVEVGQIIGCGISHPCTNFDKWRLIPLVNDNYDVVDCIHTHF